MINCWGMLHACHTNITWLCRSNYIYVTIALPEPGFDHIFDTMIDVFYTVISHPDFVGLIG